MWTWAKELNLLSAKSLTTKEYTIYFKNLLQTSKQLTFKLSSPVPWWLSGKDFTCQCRRCGSDPCMGKMSWRRKWQPTLVFLPGESHGQRSLVDCSSQGCKESDMTGWLTFALTRSRSAQRPRLHVEASLQARHVRDGPGNLWLRLSPPGGQWKLQFGLRYGHDGSLWQVF